MKKILKRISMTVTTAAIVMTVLLSSTALGQTATPTTAAAEVTDNPAVVNAASREEVVYANLTLTGETKDLYIVTILHNSESGTIADFGDFTSVKNLTDTAPVTLKDGQVSVTVPKGDFYYQGALGSTDLPWTIGVSYLLNGVEVSPDALAGASGHVAIKIETKNNLNVDPVYFNNYLLQISVTLDTSKCTNITAPNATIANAGVNKLVTFAVMPGKTSDLTLETDASEFTMAGIEFAAIPLSMQIDPPDTSAMTDDLQQLSDAVKELNEGITQLKDGSLELRDGAGDLSSGSSSFAAGLRDLSGNASDLTGGSAQIRDALSTIVASMSGSGSSENSFDLTSLQQLPDGLSQLAAGLDGISSGMSELKTGFSASYEALKAALLEIPDTTVSEAEWGRLYQANPDMKETLDKLAAYYASGVKTKATYENVRPVFDATAASLDQMTASLAQISGSLKDTAAQIKGALESNDSVAQLTQLASGLQTLSAQYNDFHGGLSQFTAGVSALNKNYGALDAGISGLSDGTGDLSDGIGKTADGVAELYDGVKDLPQKTDEEIQKLMDAYDKSDVKPVSFASSKNVNTIAVQFVMKTDKIDLPELPEPTPEITPKETVWDRFVDLFK